MALQSKFFGTNISTVCLVIFNSIVIDIDNYIVILIPKNIDNNTAHQQWLLLPPLKFAIFCATPGRA